MAKPPPPRRPKVLSPEDQEALRNKMLGLFAALEETVEMAKSRQAEAIKKAEPDQE